MRRRTGRRWLTLAPEPQIDQHRIVIGAAELVGGVQRGLQAGALEVDVVVQRGRLVGVDRPVLRTHHLRRHRGAGQRVVQIAPAAIEDMAGGRAAAGVAADQVGPALGGEGAHCILAGIGVEVADHQQVGLAGAGRIGGQPLAQRDRGAAAHLGAFALAVAGIRRVAGAALALEVVDRDDEACAVALLEGLRQRRTVALAGIAATHELCAVEHRGAADRLHPCRAIDQRDLDRVAAEAVRRAQARVDIQRCPGAGRAGGIERIDQGLQRAARPVPVVLDLDQADHVGIHATDRRHRLGTLARILDRELRGLGGRTARIGAGTAAGQARSADTAAAAGDIVEEVQHVERGHPQRALGLRCTGRARVGRLEGRQGAAERADRTHAPGIAAGARTGPGPGHDADHAADAVAATQGVGGRQRQAAAGEQDRVVVLGVARVVEDQPVELLCLQQRLRGRAGRMDLGRLDLAAGRAQQHLAEAGELVVLGDLQRLRQSHQHALEALCIVGAGEGQSQLHRRDRAAAAGHQRAGLGGDLGLALEFRHRAGHPNPLADADLVAVGVEDEDRVRGGCVAVALLVLQVEAAQGRRRSLEVADDDALDGDGRAGQGGGGTPALDRRCGGEGSRAGGRLRRCRQRGRRQQQRGPGQAQARSDPARHPQLISPNSSVQARASSCRPRTEPRSANTERAGRWRRAVTGSVDIADS